MSLSLAPNIPALVPAPGGAVIWSPNEAPRKAALDEARAIFRSGKVLVALTSFVAGRLRAQPAAALFDAMELFAFVRPAEACVPSALGLARALGLTWPHTPEESVRTLHEAASALLLELSNLPDAKRAKLRSLAHSLVRAGWRWGPLVVSAIGGEEGMAGPIAGYEAWRSVAQWEDEPAPGKPSSHPVDSGEAHARLAALIGPSGETRPEQVSYLDASLPAFAPRERAGAPAIALVEAGTGIGKTLGYLAPASLWAEKNGPGLWISTFTRNLQRQIMQELARLYPDPVERNEKAVIRKGRENYLCLLNYEETVRRLAVVPGQRAVALGLVARWIGATTDGDVSGAEFPAFVSASFPLSEITDRRGECIYAACPHYRACFIERAVRRARTAPIVIANHALVIAQAAQDAFSLDENNDVTSERSTRFVFDEGHHLFDAADSGFAALLSGREMAELRRWIRGGEGRTRGRMRGLEERLRDLIKGDDDARDALSASMSAAGALAGPGWTSRLHGGGPNGPGEAFLGSIYSQVRARSADQDSAYTLECDVEPLAPELSAAARELRSCLAGLTSPLLKLASRLRKKIQAEADKLESGERARIQAAIRGVERRAKIIVPTWIGMLDALGTNERSDEFVDWLEIAREDGRDVDVGLERHWIDPTIPFAADVLVPAQGVLITSATLRDTGAAEDWSSAEIRTGALHLPEPARRASFGSPFRYGEQARIFVIRDVDRRESDAFAAAYRELFLASDGGALGLFTSVRTLRAVESRISAPLADAGISLYAQHVDRLDTGALIDLFRSEENACLLGTDALRDGVDVPGRSLRLVVFDKVPWPRPTILHKARRARFGRDYDDRITRLRLKQAFGRLIRTQSDRGCFVVLEPATPSRLLEAFPPEAPVKRCGLAEAIAEIREFLERPR